MSAGAAAPLTNWAGNYTYDARTVLRPGSDEELRDAVLGATSLRAIGTRHSFTAIADAETLISWEALVGAAEISIDRAAMTACVGPAVSFAQLAVALNREGLALANLASLPHISVCGAMATATHGSGPGRNLADAVVAMEILTADGELVTLGTGDPRLAGAAVHLGALGIVRRLWLSVIPSYEVAQQVYEELEWDALYENFEAIFGLGRSVSAFHNFGPRVRALWVKSDARDALPDSVFGAAAANGPRHPLPGGDTDATTVQLGVPGPWSERLAHFRSGFMPSNGAEIQSEVFVARADAVAALEALRAIGDQLAPALLTAELRTVAADELWLSPQYQRDSLALHFTWRRDAEAVARNVALIERALAPLAPRPHWGKVFAMDPATLAGAYARAAEFAALRAELDPRGVFVNRWLAERAPFLLAG